MQQYKFWNQNRLGDDGAVSYEDSYWFAYISTTTVGLGDFILLPDVLVTDDIVIWPLSFLIGFVFFAAFLGKIATMITNPLQAQGIDLVKRLKLEHPAYETSEGNDEALETAKDVNADAEPVDDAREGSQSAEPPRESAATTVGMQLPEFDMEDDQSDQPSERGSVAAGSVTSSITSVKMESLVRGYLD